MDDDRERSWVWIAIRDHVVVGLVLCIISTIVLALFFGACSLVWRWLTDGP